MLKKRSRSSENTGTIRSGRIFAGGVFGLLLTIALTFSAALAVTREVLPQNCTTWLGPVIILVSAFFSALTAAHSNRKKLLCGLFAAMLYSSGMMICGLLLFTAPMQFGRMMLSLAALLVGMLLGVFVSGMKG